MKKKSFLIFGIFVLIIIAILLSQSFGFWKLDFLQDNKNSGKSTCFDMTFEEKSEAISLLNGMPISDEEGKSLKPFVFKIQNHCDNYATYDINLENLIYEGKRLAPDYLKIAWNEAEAHILNHYPNVTPTLDNSDESFRLESGTLAPKGEAGDQKEFLLRLWIDEETPAVDETSEATFESKITVTSSPKESEDINNTINVDSISKTDKYNRELETIELNAKSDNFSLTHYLFSNQKVTNYENISSWILIQNQQKEFTIQNTYYEKGTYYFYIRDERGNVKETEIKLIKIDRYGPEITISDNHQNEYVELNLTFQDMQSGLKGYQITESSEIPSEYKPISGNNQNIVEQIEQNGTYYIWVIDQLDNVSYQIYSASKIDQTAPEIILKNKLTTWGVKDTLSIEASDDLIGLSAYSISNQKNTFNWISITNTLTYQMDYDITLNGTYYVSFKDAYNHITTKEIVIRYVDNISPGISSIVSKNVWTPSDIITVKAQDTISGISGYQFTNTNVEPTTWTTLNGVTTEQTLTYTVNQNGTYYFWVKDQSNNIASKSISISKIDKDKPSISYAINSQTAGSNGWYQALSLKVNNSDGTSGIKSVKYCVTTSSCTPNIVATLSSNSFIHTFGSNIGSQKVCAEAFDQADNSSGMICSSSYYVDAENPTAKISTSVSGNSITISANGSSDIHSGIATYYYSRDNVNWYSSTSTTYNFTGLNDGSYTLYLKVVDKSGRTSSVVSANAVVAYTNVYLASNGNDSGNGSSSSPFLTLSKAYNWVKSGGTITLLNNITATSTTYFNSAGKTVNLTSNGSNKYSIIKGSGLTNQMIAISNTNTLNISNITINGNNVASTTAMINVGGGTTFNVNSNATIQGANTTTTYTGGGVSVSGTMNLNGGTITGNKSTTQGGGQGGGIYINGGALTINSGTVSNNSSSDGGGIFVWQGTLNIKGGTFSSNSANSSGGSVWIGGKDRASNLSVSGGSFTGNNAYQGGAIYISSDNSTIVTTATFTGGTFTNNKASWGGGIDFIQANGTLSNTIFNNNTATEGGGALNVDGISTVTMNSGTKVEYNTASSGGGIHITNNAILNINGSLINSNTATNGNGGGIVVWKSTLNLLSGSITNNETKNSSGGGISYISASKGTISGGTISGNKANSSGGGGIVFGDSLTSVTITNVNIINNTASWGGGIAVWGTSTVYFKGGTIQNNIATGNAGGVDVNNSSFYQQGGNVINNQGGGISGCCEAKYYYSSGNRSGNAPFDYNI